MAGNGDDSQQRIVINFIDPLFSVALGGSFTQIIAELWFKDWRIIWHQPAIFFAVATLVLLGYFTVILSWVGYHQSIKNHPIKVETSPGRWRFALDVILLMIYFVLLVSYDHFPRELWTLAVIYGFFIIWDQMKRAEAAPFLAEKGRAAKALSEQERTAADAALASEKKTLQLRRGVTVFWFLVYLILALFYQLFTPIVHFECRDWLVLLAAFAGTFLYRIHKEHRKPEWLLLLLGKPNAS